MQLFISSGDLIADRRYEFGKELERRGDLGGAADLYAQAVEVAPVFASAWFALGELAGKASAGKAKPAGKPLPHRRAAADPEDRHGAAGATRAAQRRRSRSADATPGYVRTTV